MLRLLHLHRVVHLLNQVLHVKLSILVCRICLGKLDPGHNVVGIHHHLIHWHLLMRKCVVRIGLKRGHQRSFKVKLLSYGVSMCGGRRCRHRVGLLSHEGRLILLGCVKIEEVEITVCVLLILRIRLLF